MITILTYEDNINLREFSSTNFQEKNLKVVGEFGDCIDVEQQVSKYQPV